MFQEKLGVLLTLSWVAYFNTLDEDKNCVVEFKGPNVKHISGSPISDNHTVNLLSSLMTALVTPFIAVYIF